MDGNAVVALLGAAVLGFVVRVFNTVVAWLSRVLGVEAPEPIPTRAGAAASVPPAGEPVAGDPTPPGTDTPGEA